MTKITIHTAILVFFTLCLSCTFFGNHITVQESGMEPAIRIGDKVEYNKFNNNLTYGDIVVSYVDEDWRPNLVFLSRVVGLPGDHITIENGICVINGKKNKHKLLEKQFSFYEHEEILPNGVKIRIFSFDPHDISPNKTVTIPDDHYFLMGDYRSSNMNSRIMGPIPRKQIIGKVTGIHRP